MAARVFLSSRLAGQLAAVNNCGRRSYAAAAAAAAVARQEPATAGTARLAAAAAEEEEAPARKEFFWMMDPKTGYWMPENHFGDVDAADLRAQLLFSKNEIDDEASEEFR